MYWRRGGLSLYVYAYTSLYKQVYRRRYEAADRRSPNCIRKTKNKIRRKTISNMADGILSPCNVARGNGIMTLNSPGGSTMQCGTWLYDMPLNSPKRPPYWNPTSGFDFDPITAVDMSFCISLRNFYPIRDHPRQKNYVMSIFKMADLRHLGFYGSNNRFFEKPMYYFL